MTLKPIAGAPAGVPIPAFPSGGPVPPAAAAQPSAVLAVAPGPGLAAPSDQSAKDICHARIRELRDRRTLDQVQVGKLLGHVRDHRHAHYKEQTDRWYDALRDALPAGIDLEHAERFRVYVGVPQIDNARVWEGPDIVETCMAGVDHLRLPETRARVRQSIAAFAALPDQARRDLRMLFRGISIGQPPALWDLREPREPWHVE